MQFKRRLITSLFVTMGASQVAHADFVSYQGDADGWFAAAGETSVIRFDDFEVSTQITDQYAGLGVNFLASSADIARENTVSFPRDEWGLYGGTRSDVIFDAPIHAFAAHYPGRIRLEFYLGAEFLFESPLEGGGGIDFFSGYVSDEGFDRVVARGVDSSDPIYFDNIYFSTVPAPGALALLVVGTSGRRRRR